MGNRMEENIFISKDEFEKMIAKDELIEYARYVKNYYGTPKEYVRKQLDAGKDVILEIEIQRRIKSERGISRYFAFVCDTSERR